MKNSNPTPLRQKFIQFLTLRDLAERTVHAYTSYIIQLAKFHGKSPDLLSPQEVHSWFFHLISKRKYSASSVNIALNAVHSFYGKFLGHANLSTTARYCHVRQERLEQIQSPLGLLNINPKDMP